MYGIAALLLLIVAIAIVAGREKWFSKPVRRASATWVSEPAEPPANTRHEATSVAPFQLAHTEVAPREIAAASRGGSAGTIPLHGNLKTR